MARWPARAAVGRSLGMLRLSVSLSRLSDRLPSTFWSRPFLWTKRESRGVELNEMRRRGAERRKGSHLAP